MKDEVFGSEKFVRYLYDRWGIDLLNSWTGAFGRAALDHDFFYDMSEVF